MPDFATMAIRKCVSFPLSQGNKLKYKTTRRKEKFACSVNLVVSKQYQLGRTHQKCPKVPNTNSLQRIDSFEDSYVLIYLAELL